jgi:4-hydroxybenzoate polyprenyltransferase
VRHGPARPIAAELPATEREAGVAGRRAARESSAEQPPVAWWRSLWIELRPRQWVKNVLVLAPVLFAHQLFAGPALLKALAAFGLFCLMSSSIYLLNDLKDAAEDRRHPVKRRRPIAAGQLGVPVAVAAMVVLFLLALAGAFALSPAFAGLLGAYWAMNFLYSSWLKHQVILDVFVIAGGFVLRVVGGGVAIGVPLSDWLLICTTLLALFLGFSKRRHELDVLGEAAASHRQVLSEYSRGFLDMMIGVVTASTVMSYALYTVSEETVRKFHTRALLLTLPFVLYGIFRYLYLVYQKREGGDPTQTLLSDRPTLVNLLLWAAVATIIIYSWH